MKKNISINTMDKMDENNISDSVDLLTAKERRDQGLRKCTKCKTTKKLDDFCNYKKAPSGKTYLCKECAKIKAREYYAKNREKIIERAKKSVYDNYSDYKKGGRFYEARKAKRDKNKQTSEKIEEVF